MSDFFSTIECACGCRNLLTMDTVNKGRTFIWGHKTKIAPGQTKRKALKAPRTQPGKRVEDCVAWLTTTRDALQKRVDELAVTEDGYRKTIEQTQDALTGSQNLSGTLRDRINGLNEAIDVLAKIKA